MLSHTVCRFEVVETRLLGNVFGVKQTYELLWAVGVCLAHLSAFFWPPTMVVAEHKLLCIAARAASLTQGGWISEAGWAGLCWGTDCPPPWWAAGDRDPAKAPGRAAFLFAHSYLTCSTALPLPERYTLRWARGRGEWLSKELIRRPWWTLLKQREVSIKAKISSFLFHHDCPMIDLH